MVQALFCTDKARFLPLTAASALLISITVPYVMSIIKERVRSFLPYVSHAAAFPPQAAIFSIFMSLGAFFSMITFLLRYVAVEHRRHHLDPQKIKLSNRIAFCVGLVAAISLVFASHFPLAFVTHEKYDWIIFVIVPHFLGSIALVIGFTVYILIQSFLTYTQRRKSSINISAHASLALGISVLIWTTCLPLYSAMRELLPQTINEETGEINLETQEYSFYYIISSLSGWGFFLLVFMFIASFYKDMKDMKLTLTIRPKVERVKLDSVESAVVGAIISEGVTKM